MEVDRILAKKTAPPILYTRPLPDLRPASLPDLLATSPASDEEEEEVEVELEVEDKEEGREEQVEVEIEDMVDKIRPGAVYCSIQLICCPELQHLSFPEEVG